MIKRIHLLWLALISLLMSVPALGQSTAAPFTTGYRYDSSRQLVGVIKPDPDDSGPLAFPATRNSYDATGRIIKIEEGELSAWQAETVLPISWTGFTIFKITETSYDGLDHKTKVTVKERTQAGDVIRAVAQYSYDSVGRLECTAVRMDPAQWTGQTDACLPQTTGPDGADRITRNVYDDAGRVAQFREGVGTTSEAAEATYSYTPNGKREYLIDGEGNRAKFVYDGHDRVSCWALPSKTKASNYNAATQSTALSSAGAVGGDCTTTDATEKSNYEKYTYDDGGNRLTLRKRDSRVVKYSYDALNRVTSKCVTSTTACVAPNATTGRDVYYTYDLMGHQRFARFDSATGTDYVENKYNGFGELTSSETGMSGTARKLQYDYDLASNRVSLSHPDGQNFTYSYDGLNRLNGIYEGAGTGTSLEQFVYNSQALPGSRTDYAGTGATYTYDKIGRLTGLADAFAGGIGNVTQSLAYNSASGIKSEIRDNDAYAFSRRDAGNRSYSVNGLNQYTSVASTNFTYDQNGNLIGDGTSTYIFDAENRLVSGTANSQTTTLTYDPLGRLWRILKGSADTRFLYDGDALVAEYDAAGTLTARYVHGSDAKADDPLVWYDRGTKRWLHADRHGSIVAVTNASGGPSINSYDEYGVPATDANLNNLNTGRFQYTGQAWIKELGIYYYKARMYSPTLGRFLQVDPIGYDDQVNLYEYVGNDPINKADPTGELCEEGWILCLEKAGGAAVSRTKLFWSRVRFLAGTAGTGLGVYERYQATKSEVEENTYINVYRVFDGKNAPLYGRSWTQENPLAMKNWRDRLAVYPAWNEGTKVVKGQIRMSDLFNGNVQRTGNFRSMAGPQPFDQRLGGGPYKGEGNELIIPNAAQVVINPIIMPGPEWGRRP